MLPALAQPILAHTMAQSTLELLALMAPIAIIFGIGSVMVLGPVVRAEGERYQLPPSATISDSVAAATSEPVSAPTTAALTADGGTADVSAA